MSTFSNKLSQLMMSFDMSDDKLAKLVSVNRTTVSRWRSGERSPKLEKLPEIAAVFNISPQAFVGENSVISIEPIFSQLDDARKQNVIHYASQQLKQQKNNKVVDLNSYRNKEAENNIANIYGSVSAGTGEYLDDIKPEQVSVKGPVPDNYDFAVKVNGDSMTPAFSDKQIIFVKKVEDDSEIRNNQFVIAELNGEAFIKKLHIDDSGIKLISLNPKYNDIFIHDYDDFVVRGIVVF